MLSLSCRLSLLCAAGLLEAGTAQAQITTNAQALDSLSSPEALALNDVYLFRQTRQAAKLRI
ncbi:hypothetical protein JK182_16480, partial [Acetobacter okinawensis]|nr:hypothetical protein [Acetobacter okinawensis]